MLFLLFIDVEEEIQLSEIHPILFIIVHYIIIVCVHIHPPDSTVLFHIFQRIFYSCLWTRSNVSFLQKCSCKSAPSGVSLRQASAVQAFTEDAMVAQNALVIEKPLRNVSHIFIEEINFFLYT